MEIYNQGLEMASKLGAKDIFCHILFHQAELFLKDKDIQKALNNYNQILHNQEALNKTLINYSLLKNTYQKLIKLQEDKEKVNLYTQRLKKLEEEWKDIKG
jgi:hypothetical protein